MPYWRFGDIAETFGLVELAMHTAVVGQWVIRMFKHVGVTLLNDITRH